MKTAKTKFRYVNETVGAMVIFGLLLFTIGVIMAGKAQGWFEGTIAINAVFMSAEGQSSAEQGSFNLQEGDEVKIRSARAGQVKTIEPLDNGGLQAVLEIKSRFHRYVRVDSVARVKRMFGLAGDTHMEISDGQGAQIEDGGSIPCYRDEELMEIARSALTKIEGAVLPMVEQTSGVMSNANKITSELGRGRGLIGTMINDPLLTEEVRDSIRHLNELLTETSMTVAEGRRLIQGAQKHWLLRKYIPDDDPEEFISPLFAIYGAADPALERKCASELSEARISADGREVSRAAYNMAVCQTASRRLDAAALLLEEADLSPRRGKLSVAHNSLLRALLYSEDQSATDAFLAIGIIEDPPDNMEFEEFSEFISAAYLILLRAGRNDQAEELYSQYFKKIMKKGSHPARAAFYGGMAQALNSEPDKAAMYADLEAKELAEAGLYYGAAKSLARAGQYYEETGDMGKSALRHLFAGKSLLEQGFKQEADTMIDSAYRIAQILETQGVALYINMFREEMKARETR